MSVDQLAITEKYESFVDYVYPIAQSLPRRHGVAREKFLQAVFEQVNLLTIAGKSNQISRLYAADAGLAYLRFWLRFLAHPGRKLIGQHQHRVALAQLAEVGRLLGAWIQKSQKARG